MMTLIVTFLIFGFLAWGKKYKNYNLGDQRYNLLGEVAHNALRDLMKSIELGGEDYISQAKSVEDLDIIRTDSRFKDLVYST